MSRQFTCILGRDALQQDARRVLRRKQRGAEYSVGGAAYAAALANEDVGIGHDGVDVLEELLDGTNVVAIFAWTDGQQCSGPTPLFH